MSVAGKYFPAAPLALIVLLISCPAGQAMELTSSDFTNGGKLSLAQVSTRCGGQNRSPALRWSRAPAGTRSFAVTKIEPDARGGAGFWHWLAFDISPDTSGLPEAAGTGTGLPSGAEEGVNDFGDPGYGGACPPTGSGVHHYEFTLYALGTARPPFDANAKGTDLSAWLKAHALATTLLTAVYAR